MRLKNIPRYHYKGIKASLQMIIIPPPSEDLLKTYLDLNHSGSMVGNIEFRVGWTQIVSPLRSIICKQMLSELLTSH